MFTDFRDPQAPGDFNTDICVIGAGAAGISFALRLANSSLRICLLESGGFELEPDVQSLYAGNSVGQKRADPLNCRLRYFGGTTNHWEGWCAPLDDRDFESRHWIPDSGWPLQKSELDSYYASAQDILELGDGSFDRTIQDDANTLQALEADNIAARQWKYSPPTRFGTRYRKDLERNPNVEVVLYANAVKICTDQNAKWVEKIVIQTLAGRVGSVRARCYVLACGGMENARLLLQTNDVEQAGLGNRSGTLGRYFIQHPERKVASILTDQGGRLISLFDRQQFHTAWYRTHLTCATSLQQRLGLLNAGFDIRSRPQYGAGYAALREIVNDIEEGGWPTDLDTRIWTMLRDLGNLSGDLYGRLTDDVSTFDLVVHAEQTPNPDSRISLIAERDALGMPKLEVDWRLCADDKRSIITSTMRVAEALTRANLGRVKIEDWLLDGDNQWPERIWSGCHHMGTTRMSADPGKGVVNRDARLHDVDNLYIAGSSIFPTGGYVTPTLTIVALTLRLADHLKRELSA